jgi:ABC-type lipopolysaccharide export system ATPase subunit
MPQGAAIEIQGLTKIYGDVKAIDAVSLTVAEGEFVTLLGLSGSGKSTTLMAVAGFVEPDDGAIAISGSDVTTLPPEKTQSRRGVSELRSVPASECLRQYRLPAAHAPPCRKRDRHPGSPASSTSSRCAI